MAEKKPDAWASFFMSFNRIHAGMEDTMKAHGLPGLEIYDVLWVLEKAPPHGLRFNELGKKTFLSRSNVTRLAERLEEQGLIERHRCPSDRRGVYAALTPAGKKLRQEMWKTYGRLIKERFTDQLTEADQVNLVKILDKVWNPLMELEADDPE